MLSRLVIAFLPKSKHLLISWLQSPSAVILEPPKIVCHCFYCYPIYLPWSDGIRCHDFGFLNAEFYANFSLSSFTFFKRLFSSSSPFFIRVVSSVYLRLLIFLPTILIPACASSSINDNTESTKKSTKGKSWGGRDKGSWVVTDPHTLSSRCYHMLASCCVLLLLGILTTRVCALPYTCFSQWHINRYDFTFKKVSLGFTSYTWFSIIAVPR